MNSRYVFIVAGSAPTNCPLFLMGLTSGQAANLVVPTIKLTYWVNLPFISYIFRVGDEWQSINKYISI